MAGKPSKKSGGQALQTEWRVNFGLAEGGKRGVGRKTGCPHYSGREAKFPD